MAKKPLTLQEAMTEIEDLRARLEEAHGCLNAIRSGEVDAVVAMGPEAERAQYREHLMQEALRESEQRFRAIFDSAGVGIAFAYPDGRIIDTNQALQEMLGYTSEELRTLNCKQFTHNEDLPAEMEHICEALEGSGRYHLEKRYVRKDGETIWVSFTGTVLFDSAGKPEYGLAVAENITDRREMEEALRESELRLRLTLESGQMGAWEWNVPTNTSFWNAKEYEFLGLPVGDGRVATDLFLRHVHPEDRADFDESLAQTMKDGSNWSHEFRVIRADGEVRHLAGVGRLFRDDQGNPLRMIGVNYDITERKQAEDALNRYKILAENSRDIILFVNVDGKIIEANDAASSTYGYTRDELLTLSIFDLRAPESVALTKDQMAIADASGLLFETVHRRKDGSFFDVEVSSRGTDIGDQRILLSIIRDITERKRAEDALTESEKRYRTLFSSMSEGFALCEIILDEQGKPCDWRYIELNPAFERNTGLTVDDVAGKTVREVLPNIESYWIENYGRVALTGQPTRFENYLQELNKYFEVFAFSPARGQFAVLFVDVTDRKQAEDALRESESILHAFFDSPGMMRGIVDVEDGDIRYVSANKAVAATHGLTPDAVNGKFLSELGTPPEIVREYVDQCEESRRTGQVVSFELLRHFADGDRWLFITTSYLGPGPTGYPRFAYVILDITERKRAEEALRESEERLHLALQAGGGVWDFDLESGYAWWSPEMYDLWGLEHGTPIQLHNVLPVVYEQDREHAIEVMEDAITRCAEYRDEYRIYHSSLGERWLSAYGRLTCDETGRPMHLLGIAVDVTERKRAEEALRESEERLRLLGNNLPDSAVYQYTHNADGSPRFLYISSGIEQLNGVKVEDVTRDARTLYDQILPEYHPAIEEAEAVSARNLSDFDMDVQMRRPDGEVRWMRLKSRPRRLPDGRVIWDGVQIDITERKRAEKILAADLVATMCLQQIGARFVKAGQLAVVLGDIVDAAITITHADMGNIQLLDAQSGCLKITASRGFEQPFLDFWNTVAEGQGACGTAMSNAQRAIVEDVAQSPIFVGTPALEVQLNAGVRAVQSTPLFSHSGAFIGMLSTHWHTPHQPEQRDLHMLDLLAQEAVDIIELSRTDDALRESERRYSALFANKTNGIAHCRVITDENGRPVDYVIVQINEAYERIIGIKKADIEGRRVKEVFPDIENYAFDYIGIYGKIALEGGEIKFEEFFEATGQYLSIYAYSPLPGEFAAIFTDVTDQHIQKLALAHARAEAERHAAELESFVSSMSEGIVLFDNEPKVLLVNEATKKLLNPPPDVPYEVWIEAYELRTLDDEQVPIENYPSRRALRGEVTKDARFRMVTPWSESLVSITGSPAIDAHGHVIGGSISFTEISDQLEFEQQQKYLLDRERHIAEVLQKALIPDTDYKIPGCEIAVRYEAALDEAQVGGDFYDIFDMGDNKIGILIGDVAGKGLAAAIQVAAARHSFRSYAYIDPRPERVMTLANNALCKDPEAGITLLTAFFAVVDLELGVISYANGGHETPILRRFDGTVEELAVQGRALGVMVDFEYTDRGARLNPGDMITIVTDGITEARPDSSHLFGLKGMKAFLSKKKRRSADELAQGLLRAAKKHSGGILKDDAAIIVFGLQKEKKLQ